MLVLLACRCGGRSVQERGMVTATEANLDNKRGYAYTAFKNTYDKMCSWSWFAAYRAAGEAPTRWEYIKDGLRLYDRMMLEPGADHVKITRDIVKYLSQTNRSDCVGKLGFARTEEGDVEVFVKHPVPDEAYYKAEYVERGYRDVELSHELVDLVGRLVPFLSGQQRRILGGLVVHDMHVSDTARALRLTPQAVYYAIEKMRKVAAANHLRATI